MAGGYFTLLVTAGHWLLCKGCVSIWRVSTGGGDGISHSGHLPDIHCLLLRAQLKPNFFSLLQVCDHSCYCIQVKLRILKRFLKMPQVWWSDANGCGRSQREGHLPAKVWAEPWETFHSWHHSHHEFPKELMLQAIISCSSSPSSQLLACAWGSTQQLGHICLPVPAVCMSHVGSGAAIRHLSRRCG